MIDTCQAASMYEKFYSPNILAVASSLVGEDSLSVNSFFYLRKNIYLLNVLASCRSCYRRVYHRSLYVLCSGFLGKSRYGQQ